MTPSSPVLPRSGLLATIGLVPSWAKATLVGVADQLPEAVLKAFAAPSLALFVHPSTLLSWMKGQEQPSVWYASDTGAAITSAPTKDAMRIAPKVNRSIKFITLPSPPDAIVGELRRQSQRLRASVHHVNAGGRLGSLAPVMTILSPCDGMAFLPFTCSAACLSACGNRRACLWPLGPWVRGDAGLGWSGRAGARRAAARVEAAGRR